MALSITDRTYKTRNNAAALFPIANAGQIVTETFKINVDFNFISSNTEQVLFVAVNKLQLIGSSNPVWAEKGIAIGDVLELSGTIAINANITLTSTSVTVIDIVGNLMTVQPNIEPTVPLPPPFQNDTVVGSLMPQTSGTNSNTPLTIVNTTNSAPDAIEFYHNLIANSTTSGINSLFDGEVNRFLVEGVGAMVVTDVIQCQILGKKSGGAYISAQLERLADVSGQRVYEVTLRYGNPYKFFDADFTEPLPYQSNESLKPFYRVICYPQYNNPNAGLQVETSNLLGNFGWYNENFNQGENDFTVESVTILDSLGNALTQPDHSQENTIKIVINGSAAFKEDVEVEMYLIPNIDLVKENINSFNNNTFLTNFHVDSIPTVSTDVFGLNGAQLVTSSQTVTIGVNQITIEFKITPNTEYTNFVESLAATERRYRITANVESDGLATNTTNSVSLICKEGFYALAPIPDVPYTKVNYSGFLNHSQDIGGVTVLNYDGCTEDDILYNSVFKIDKDDIFDSMRLEVQIENISTGATFDLFSRIIGLQNTVVTPNGVMQINYNETLQQYLDSPNRNGLSVALTGVETGTDYEVQIIWSMFANWRYWLQNTSAPSDFYDSTLPNNGLNAEWIRYLQVAGYQLRTKVTLIKNSVGYYWTNLIALQNYDDTADVTSVLSYKDQNGNAVTSLLQNQVMEITATHTLSSGTWDVLDVWAWIGVRPKEGEPMKHISTEWDWTSQNMPLKPLTGLLRAELTFPNPDEAVVKCLIDTSQINVATSTVVSRVETPKIAGCTSPIDYMFDYLENNYNPANPQTYYDSMTALFTAGSTPSGLCCPVCVDAFGGFSELNIWAFAPKTILDALIADAGITACCYTNYGTPNACNANFDTEVDNLAALLTGFETTITDTIPSELNTYTEANLVTFAARMNTLTGTVKQKYEIMRYIANFGIMFYCWSIGDENGQVFYTADNNF